MGNENSQQMVESSPSVDGVDSESRGFTKTKFVHMEDAGSFLDDEDFVNEVNQTKSDNHIKIDDFWPNFAKNLQNDTNLVKSIIDTATCFYFYHKAEVSGSSLL